MKRILALALAALSLAVTPAFAVGNPTKLKKDVHITGKLQVDDLTATRQVIKVALSPTTGAAVNSTVYRLLFFPGRAGTVTKVSFGAEVAPIGGTDTLKVLKGSSAGATMLSTATVDATTLVANTATAPALTATAANLAVTATQGIYVEYSQGTTTTAAQDVTVTLEFLPTLGLL